MKLTSGDCPAGDDVCPVCATAELVCAKWTILVIRDLAEGRSRFCELERSLAGISPRTLSLRLRALEARWWCPTCEQTVDDPDAEDEVIHV